MLGSHYEGPASCIKWFGALEPVLPARRQHGLRDPELAGGAGVVLGATGV